MSQSAARKVLVVGGSGFLGRSVCKAAVSKGWETLSLSKRGEPKAFQSGRPAWADNVEWFAGNSLDPSTYADRLDGVTSVVHTVGILMENDAYKKVMNADTLWGSVSNAACMLAELGGMRDRGNPLKSQGQSSPVTFEMMNRDTACTVATQAAKIPSMACFVYISASDVFPMVNPRYITTKREAECFLFSRPEFRSVVLRPGFMYSHERRSFAALLEAANSLTQPVAKDMASLPLGKVITTPPLHIDTVAAAVVESIENQATSGIYDVEGIQQLAGHAQGVTK